MQLENVVLLLQNKLFIMPGNPTFKKDASILSSNY